MRPHHHFQSTRRYVARVIVGGNASSCRRYSARAPPAAAASSTSPDSMTPETSAAVDCLSSALIGFHWETHPADTDELQRAAAFFRRAPPQVMYTASSLYQVPYTGLPEVAFLGRSNVGKSTLLNALLGTKVCRTSSKPGKTRALHAYAVGDSSGTIGSNGDGRKLAKTAPTKTTAPTAPTPPPSPPRSQLTVLDMPGYGHGSRAEWGRTVATYLARRRELRRAFVLVDALHGIKERDALMLEELRAAGVAHQVVLSKVDRVVLPQHATGRNVQRTTWERKLEHLATLVAAVRKVAQPEGKDARGRGQPALGEILCVSADMGRYSHLSDEAGGTMGVNALRWSVLAATGLTGFGGGRKPRVGDEDSPILIDESR